MLRDAGAANQKTFDTKREGWPVHKLGPPKRLPFGRHGGVSQHMKEKQEQGYTSCTQQRTSMTNIRGCPCAAGVGHTRQQQGRSSADLLGQTPGQLPWRWPQTPAPCQPGRTPGAGGPSLSRDQHVGRLRGSAVCFCCCCGGGGAHHTDNVLVAMGLCKAQRLVALAVDVGACKAAQR